jgi:hypothetical protein
MYMQGLKRSKNYGAKFHYAQRGVSRCVLQLKTNSAGLNYFTWTCRWIA